MEVLYLETAVASIGSSVGKKNNGTEECYNVPQDQKVVIDLLNQVDGADGGTKQSPLNITPHWGVCDGRLYKAILNFQTKQKGLSVDGHFDPGGAAVQKLNELAARKAPTPDVPKTAPVVVEANKDAVGPPYDSLDAPLLATLRRSWKQKSTENQNLAYPLGFIGVHKPLTFQETLSELDSMGLLSVIQAVYNRCKIAPDIWPRIRAILESWDYVGGNQISEGFKFTCDDSDGLLNRMRSLSKSDKKFCEDTTSVHGPRDCFREIIKTGAGLHVCVTQVEARSSHHHDIHIDKFQMVCTTQDDGYCDYHHLTANSARHYWDAIPWVISEQRKAAEQKLKDELDKLKQGLPRPGQRGPW